MITLRLVAGVLVLLGLVPMANLVTTGPGLPWWSAAAREWGIYGCPVVAVALLAGFSAPARIESLFARATRLLLAPSSRWFAIMAATLSAMLSLWFGRQLFGLEPVAGDEFAQRFHALILSRGKLHLQAPLPAEFFSTSQTLDVRGRWFTQFPVGGPALLALGALAGAPWLVNPILGSIAVVALYDFARTTTGDEAMARGATLLAALCPMLFFMAGTQMNHTGALALLWIALAALARWQHADSARSVTVLAAIIGATVGLAATIRPFDAFVVALLTGMFQLWAGRRHHSLTRSIVVECVVAAIPVALLLAANAATTGAPFAFAYDVLNGVEHRPGFHLTPLGFEHTPRRGLYMASAYLMKLDIALFAWPLPAMLLVAATLVAKKHATAWDQLSMALIIAFLAGYAAYWSESYFLGPRFLFAVAPILVLYTAQLPAALRARTAKPPLRAAALLLIPLLLVASWAIPGGGTQQFGVRRLVSLYRMRSGAPAVHAEVRRLRLDNAVVFLAESWRERLAARLRAIGIRPLLAEQLLAQVDACTLQRLLDSMEGRPEQASGGLAQMIIDAVQRDAFMGAAPAAPQRDRIALSPNRPMTPQCMEERMRTPPFTVTLAEMLRYAEPDASGALGGRVIYARDFGARNERLRASYGDRKWYIARTTLADGVPTVTIQPAQPR